MTQGKYAIVDKDDYEKLSEHKWCVGKEGNVFYAQRKEHRTKTIKMHNVIMNTPKGFEVDHRDSDGLNNQKYNLRICTHQQNMFHKRPKKGRKYKGVYASIGKYSVVINCNGKSLRLCGFRNEVEAAKAYDLKAKELHGEFAYLNFP